MFAVKASQLDAFAFIPWKTFTATYQLYCLSLIHTWLQILTDKLLQWQYNDVIHKNNKNVSMNQKYIGFTVCTHLQHYAIPKANKLRECPTLEYPCRNPQR